MPLPLDIQRVSVSSLGIEGNYGSRISALSDDGRYVVFHSGASNLVPGDTTSGFYGNDVFRYDRETGTTMRVSLNASGGQANGASFVPSISSDGQLIAYESLATDIVAGISTSIKHTYVYDVQTGVSEIIDVSTAGNVANNPSVNAVFSGDGRYVVFNSYASNLVAGDTNGKWDVFVRDRQTDQTTRINVAADGTQADIGVTEKASISDDGRYIVFTSQDHNFSPVSETAYTKNVFLHDQQTGLTERVNILSDGSGTVFHAAEASVSGNGLYVIYTSLSTAIVAGDTNGVQDIFVYNTQTGVTTKLDNDIGGQQLNSSLTSPVISDDGRYVAFVTYASNLVTGDTNNQPDVYIHDRNTGEVALVSVATDGTLGNSLSHEISISGNGQFVSFTSSANTLVAGDTNGQRDIFVAPNPLFANVVYGTAGADILLGTSGEDIMNGYDGSDILNGYEGVDILDGGLGNDYMTGGAGNDVLNGGGGFDGMWGGSGADVLNGNDGNDNLRGQSGADVMHGNAGIDTLGGDAGNDWLYGDAGNDTINGGTGIDRAFGGDGDDTVNGGAGADILHGNAGDDEINGGQGSDRMYGQSGDDVMNGGDNNDSMFGHGGNDTLNGDAGNDVLWGYSGRDILNGGTGNDVLHGGQAADVLHGNDGNDTLNGNYHADRLYGDAGDDILNGGAGFDALFGGDGNDTLNGDQAADSLWGLNGADILNGGSGNDTLHGGAQQDVLNGGTDNDILHGGGDTDTFVFTNGYGKDKILDFAAANAEKIDLSGVAAITSFADLTANHLATEAGTGFAMIQVGANTITLNGYSVADIGAGLAISDLDFVF